MAPPALPDDHVARGVDHGALVGANKLRESVLVPEDVLGQSDGGAGVVDGVVIQRQIRS